MPLEDPREPRIDLSVDVTEVIRRWQLEPTYRADLTEAWLANGYLYPSPEDNRIISPTTRRAAEDEILRDPVYRDWLTGTRLAPRRIRWRRLRARLLILGQPPAKPLNRLATQTYLEAEEVSGDEWLRARTTAVVEDESRPQDWGGGKTWSRPCGRWRELQSAPGPLYAKPSWTLFILDR